MCAALIYACGSGRHHDVNIPTPLFVGGVRVLMASAFQTERANYDMTKIEIMNYLSIIILRKIIIICTDIIN